MLNPAPKPPDPARLLYGVNVVWGDNGGSANWDKNNGKRAKELVGLMKAAGVTNTLVGISWGDVERVRGKYDWSRTDKLLRFVKGQGFVLTCVVSVIPDWAGDSDPAVRDIFAAKGMPYLRGVMAPDPKFYADFGKFAQELGKRYKDIIHRWEFWNEPDGMGMPFVVRDAAGKPTDIRYGGDPVAYTKLLSLFTQNIKKAAPSCLVAVGGLATPRTDFLKGIYANNGQKAFDAVALHPYNFSGPLDFRWIEDCRKLLEQRGDTKKKFWLTEWGWKTYPDDPDGLTEGHQARLVRESLAEMKKRPYIEQASYHTLNDWRTSEHDPLTLMSMGLADQELKTRPAFSAFQSIARDRPVAAPRLRRLSLIADIPPKMKETAVRVDVHTDAILRALARPWLGISFPAFAEQQALLPELKAAGATFLRLNPFASREIMTLATDGSPVVRWEIVDALLEKTAQSGGQVILALTPPVNLTADRWSGFVTEAAKRYGKDGRFPVVRWEMGMPQRTAGETDNLMRYYAPTFVRAIRTALPTSPVGFHILAGGDAIGALQKLASACTEANVTFDSFSWRAGGNPDEMARTLRRLRAVLAAFPGLRQTYLLPECIGFDSPAQMVAMVARLRDIASTSEPNGALGFLLSADSLPDAHELIGSPPRPSSEGKPPPVAPS